MGRLVRFLSFGLLGLGALTLAWAVTVWVWQDPVTALYTHYEQAKLSSRLDAEFRAYKPRALRTPHAEQEAVVAAATRFRDRSRPGQAIGRIVIPRLHLDMVVVNGTDESDLEKGPGHYLGSAMPGQGELVYIAGHRTTYLAPFSQIDQLRKGDPVTLEMPYATVIYRVSGYRIVPANDLSVLRWRGHEVLELQACHPRFSATHRYIAYALPVKVIPRGGRPYVPVTLRERV
jgi:sortase A